MAVSNYVIELVGKGPPPLDLKRRAIHKLDLR